MSDETLMADTLERLVAPLRALAEKGRRDDLERLGEIVEDLVLGEQLFERHRGPYVTIFGSARTSLDAPLSRVTEDLARLLRSRGWMIVAGAGPGIMAAAAKGAGLDGNIGINIELPFEHGTNPWVDETNHHMATAHFFTRKVLLTRQAHAFVALPGGVGTMDELFEVLTLLNTSKTTPAPVVLLDEPGGSFWKEWSRFMDRVISDGYLSPGDASMYRLYDDPGAAADYLDSFYRVFESAAVGGGRAVVRLRRGVSDATRAQLESLVGPVDWASDREVAFDHDGRRYARLVGAIDCLNADGEAS